MDEEKKWHRRVSLQLHPLESGVRRRRTSPVVGLARTVAERLTPAGVARDLRGRNVESGVVGLEPLVEANLRQHHRAHEARSLPPGRRKDLGDGLEVGRQAEPILHEAMAHRMEGREE